MALATILYNATGDGVSPELVCQRTKDDNGMWMIKWVPNSTPGTVTINLQVQIHPDFVGWATLKSVDEGVLGSGGGSHFFVETIPLAAKMRIQIVNNNDQDNVLVVGIQE